MCIYIYRAQKWGPVAPCPNVGPPLHVSMHAGTLSRNEYGVLGERVLWDPYY